jgi:hypothetical protein
MRFGRLVGLSPAVIGIGDSVVSRLRRFRWYGEYLKTL